MSGLVDTHCHLDLFEGIQNNPGKEDQLNINTITVTNAPSFYSKNKALFRQAESIRVALGLHPQLIGTHASQLEMFNKFIGEVKYVGEIGLDGSPEFKGSYANQGKVFQSILTSIKKEPAKILTIHSRNAAKDTIELLSSVLRGTEHHIILHWFSGSHQDLNIAIKCGYFFSINHKMAMSEKGKALIVKMPNDRILTETDAPFTYSGLVKSRVKSLETTLEGIANLKSIDKAQCREQIYLNYKAITGE